MEEWRDVPGYEGKYQVSISTKEGKCRNTNYRDTGNARLLKGSFNKGRGEKEDKRVYWSLTKDGKTKVMQAARWIAFTFPELVQNEYFEGAEIDHIDTDVLNNNPMNLRWVDDYGQQNNPLTKIHNSEAKRGAKSVWYGRKHTNETKKRMSESMKGKLLNNKSTSKPVSQYTVSGSFISSYESASQAARETGINVSNIIRCCNRIKNYNTAGGYKWSYREVV